MKQQQKQAGVTVFYSYAPADEKWRDQLANHLSQLKHDGVIEELYDQQILPGEEHARERDRMLRSAQIILLLISADFLASDTCYHVEMRNALERHKRGEARVIPILVHHCDWQHSPFAHLQCLPRNRKPTTSWVNRDEAFAAIAEELRKIITQQRSPLPPLSNEQRERRTRLLKRVREIWIDRLLEQSLQQAPWITLHLQDQPDAVENPLHDQYRELLQSPHALPAGTTIIEVYDEADRELLILGEPGAGKTTLLLQLAQTLLDRTLADELQPLPVVFNLSSWAQKKKPLADWLVEELKQTYRVPRKVGQQWIKENQVLPLLDGLDEVVQEARLGCAQAITAYHQERLNLTDVPLVVCCRSDAYRKLSLFLPLQRAVSILPLTSEQIDEYLSDIDGQLEGLRQALYNDAGLYELAQHPLMLNIFALAYQGVDAKEIPTGDSREILQRRVFAAYVQRMLNRRGHSKQVPPERLPYVLARIARWMKQEHRSSFNAFDAAWGVPMTVIMLGITDFLFDISPVLTICVLLYHGLFDAEDRRWFVSTAKFWASGLPFQLSGYVLDEATERLLLRKLDSDRLFLKYAAYLSSYMFPHPLLLEYFATLDDPETTGHTSSESSM